MKKIAFDRPLLFSIATLAIVGFIIFNSASLGLLAKESDVYSSVTYTQTFFGLFLGTIALLITSRINYKKYKKASFYIFLLSAIATLLVFLPGLGFEHGGAKRWVIIGGMSVQTSEALKIGFIIYLAAWLSHAKTRITSFKYGFLPIIALLAICGALLLSQPDTDTFAVIAVTGLSMYLIAGGKIKNILVLMLGGALALFLLAMARPYVMDRILTFVDPSRNSLTSGYQIQQSLIAIGSGGVFGRGFGQSIQKFNFLPEPIGDSIFAVAAEEFGFVGAVVLVAIFVFFALRGLRVANNSPDMFGRLLAGGIVIMIVSQAFVNMGAMLGILPLTGIPLPFVSHGGTALLMVLAEVGILLNISKDTKTEKKT